MPRHFGPPQGVTDADPGYGQTVPSRIRQLSAVAVIGVILSIVLVIVGFPEDTPTTKLLLELSALPLSVSLAASNLILLERAARLPSRRGRRTLIIGAILAAAGLIMMLISLFLGTQGLVQFGQFMVFVGLLIVLLVAIGLQDRGNSGWLDVESLGDSHEDPSHVPDTETTAAATTTDGQ